MQTVRRLEPEDKMDSYRRWLLAVMPVLEPVLKQELPQLVERHSYY